MRCGWWTELGARSRPGRRNFGLVCRAAFVPGEGAFVWCVVVAVGAEVLLAGSVAVCVRQVVPAFSGQVGGVGGLGLDLLVVFAVDFSLVLAVSLFVLSNQCLNVGGTHVDVLCEVTYAFVQRAMRAQAIVRQAVESPAAYMCHVVVGFGTTHSPQGIGKSSLNSEYEDASSPSASSSWLRHPAQNASISDLVALSQRLYNVSRHRRATFMVVCQAPRNPVEVVCARADIDPKSRAVFLQHYNVDTPSLGAVG